MKKYLKSIYIILLSIVITNCQSSEDDFIPLEPNLGLATIETNSNNVNITFTSLTISANVTSTGESTILSRGICWSTEENPTIENQKNTENSNEFTSTLENLTNNTTYYIRAYVTNETGTNYSEEQTYTTLNLANTTWNLTSYYSQINDFSIISEVIFYDDNTTRFDELDLPLQCPGCFVTYGTWSLNGNQLTYLWSGDEPSNATYIYTGTLSGMTIEGTYTHQTTEDGIWSAILMY